MWQRRSSQTSTLKCCLQLTLWSWELRNEGMDQELVHWSVAEIGQGRFQISLRGDHLPSPRSTGAPEPKCRGGSTEAHSTIAPVLWMWPQNVSFLGHILPVNLYPVPNVNAETATLAESLQDEDLFPRVGNPTRTAPAAVLHLAGVRRVFPDRKILIHGGEPRGKSRRVSHGVSGRWTCHCQPRMGMGLLRLQP